MKRRRVQVNESAPGPAVSASVTLDGVRLAVWYGVVEASLATLETDSEEGGLTVVWSWLLDVGDKYEAT